MPLNQLSASTPVPAPPERVYALLADYRDGHPRILPERYFASVVVEEGGRGAGTVLRVTMRLLGTTRSARMVVTEPDPGRVLQEADPESGLITRFLVEPQAGGGSRVTISTEWPRRPGLSGALEGALAVSYLRRVYGEELRLLESAVRSAP
jgi:hypothetical protein